MSIIFKYIIILYLVWNVITFSIMGIDKYKAEHHKWRISESTLILVAFAMGGVGSILGSYFFRHKTQKMKFKILLPLAVFINAVIIYFIIINIYKVI